MPIRFSRLWSDRRGGAAIEFVFVAPVFITLTLGAFELGRMYYVRQCMEYATEQAARYYSLNPTAATSAVTSQLNSYLPGGISVTVAYADTTNCNNNAYVTCTTLTTTYPFSYAETYLGFGNKTLTATSQAVRQQ